MVQVSGIQEENGGVADITSATASRTHRFIGNYRILASMLVACTKQHPRNGYLQSALKQVNFLFTKLDEQALCYAV